MQPFSPDGEAERLAALFASDILDTPPEAAFDRIVQLAVQSLDVLAAAVSFVDGDRQWCKAVVGLPFCELPRQHSFCAHTLLAEDIFVVPDATQDPRFAANPLVTGETQVRFYAGVVLRAPGGQALGALGVVDAQPRELDERGRTILRDLAAVTEDALTLRAQTRRLQEQYALVQDRRAALTEVNELLHAEAAQRRLVENERRRSEDRFSQIFNRASDQAIVHDDAGRIVDVNATACEALGYTREQLLAMEIDDIAEPRVSPETRRLWREMLPSEVATIESHHRHKDGTLHPVEIHLSVLETAEGRRFLGLARDITERRKQDHRLQARARQQQAIAQLGIATLRADAAQGDDGLNRLFTQALVLLGETLRMDMGSVLERLPEENLFAVRAVHGLLASAQGRVISIDASSRSPVGCALLTREPVVIKDFRTDPRFEEPPLLREQGITSALSVVIHADGEQPFGALNTYSCRAQQFTVDDIAFVQAVANILAAAVAREGARERVQKALDEAAAARRAAEQANQAKSGFLSRMSHELRTPLNAILGFGQVLGMDQAQDPREAECVQHILKAGQHLLGLINEVMDLSRAETGELHLSRSHVDVGRLVRECVGLVTKLALDRHLLCAVDLPPRHTTHWVDEQRLRQILLNLLSNAIKYNREGGHIVVGVERTAAHGLRIKVSDTGQGLTPEAIGRLFVPFERLGQELGSVQGTGLGLVVSRRLAEAMGGSLEVESELGRGSTFRIELPGDEEHTAEAAVPVPTLPPSTPFFFYDTATTVIYIEDNLPNLQLVETLLAKMRPQWRFVSARDGTKGLELVRRQAPDVILLDLHLPGLSGGQVLTELRADPKTRHLPVLMLTADVTADSQARLSTDGADGYVSKPFQVADLLERMEQALLRSPSVR